MSVLAAARLEAAREFVMGERVDWMRAGLSYWTGDHAIDVDEFMRVWLRRDATITRLEPMVIPQIRLQSKLGQLTVHFPDDDRRRQWRPGKIAPQAAGKFIPVSRIYVGAQRSRLRDEASGQALLPYGLELPVVGQLDPEGGVGYVSFDLDLAGGTVHMEAEVDTLANFTMNRRCQRDRYDLLVQAEVGGEVRRLRMVGSVAPGRENRNMRLGVLKQVEPQDEKFFGLNTWIGQREAEARQSRAALPSMLRKAPRPSGPTLQ